MREIIILIAEELKEIGYIIRNRSPAHLPHASISVAFPASKDTICIIIDEKGKTKISCDCDPTRPTTTIDINHPDSVPAIIKAVKTYSQHIHDLNQIIDEWKRIDRR